MHAKQNICFWLKKSSNRIWSKKIVAWRKKSIDEEKNLLLCALKKKDPIVPYL